MRGNTALCFPGTLFDEKRLALVKMPNREDRILGNYSGTLSWTLAILYIFSHFSIKCTLIFEKLYKFYERFPFLLTSISQPHSYHSKKWFLTISSTRKPTTIPALITPLFLCNVRASYSVRWTLPFSYPKAVVILNQWNKEGLDGT